MQNFKLNKIEFYLLILVILSITILGIYLCFIGGYGSDEDTLPMIYVFEARLLSGQFHTSRFTSYPVAEMGIGFLSYFFGSWLANLTTYLFFLLGIVFFYLALIKKFILNNFIIFLVLCLTSPVLFFDNLEPIDYSWAFLFFSFGLFFLSLRNYELAIIAFGFSIGTRINFVLFCLIAIFFFSYLEKIDFKKKIIFFLCTFVVGGLFYLPIWYNNSLGLDWLTAARPLEQGFYGLLARFSYKTIFAIGLFQTIVILIYIIKNFKINEIIKKKLLFFLIFISNLIIFLYIPAELSYLQPALIVLYFFVANNFSKSIVFLLIFFNLLSWIINFDFLKITHKYNEKCKPIQAVNAEFKFYIKVGSFQNFLSSRSLIKCWVWGDSKRDKQILQGKATRVK